LNIYGRADHIIPPPCSRALGALLTGRANQELADPTGHVGVIDSSRARDTVAPAVARWLEGIG
jgi:polyhydroxyalkanoate synthase